MDRSELIIALCREAGDTEDEEPMVAGWEANHGACCEEAIETAATGNPAALLRVRRCMGLPILR
jgi:hypothetical protein